MRAQPLSKMALARWCALRCSARMVLLVRSRAGTTKPSHGDVVRISDSERYSPQRRGADASALHPHSQPPSHGRNGENAKCDSQPRARQKRTDSVLDRKTVQDKFFKDMDVSIGLLAPPAGCVLRADWRVTR